MNTQSASHTVRVQPSPASVLEHTFVLSFPLKVASLVRRNWLPADLNLTT